MEGPAGVVAVEEEDDEEDDGNVVSAEAETVEAQPVSLDVVTIPLVSTSAGSGSTDEPLIPASDAAEASPPLVGAPWPSLFPPTSAPISAASGSPTALQEQQGRMETMKKGWNA